MVLDERVRGRHVQHVPQEDDLCADGTSFTLAALIRTSERTTDLRGVLIDAVPNLHALVQQPCRAPPAFEGPVQLPSLARLRIWSGGGHLPVLRYLGDRRGRGIEHLRDERRDLAWSTHDV